MMHPLLNGKYAPLSSCPALIFFLTGKPSDSDGINLPLGTAPPVPTLDPPFSDSSPWDPFLRRDHFELADFLYRRNQMSAGDIDELLGLWNALVPDGEHPPFSSHNDLYSLIDDIKHGGVKWQSMTAMYNQDPASAGNGDLPTWMMKKYEIWFRDPCELL